MQQALSILRSMGDSTRLRLLVLCLCGEWTVSELVFVLGQSQPRVSRHLKLLCEAGLLERFSEGSCVFHRFNHHMDYFSPVQAFLGMLAQKDDIFQQDQERLALIKSQRAKLAGEYFARNAKRWAELRSLYVDEQKVEKNLQKLLSLKGNERLLDIGTGTGRMLELFGAQVAYGQGIDLSGDMLTVARNVLEKAGLANCSVRQADLFQLPFLKEVFDVVLIHQVLHFVEEPALAIEEAGRVLKPGGRIIVVDFAPHDLAFLKEEHRHRWLGFSSERMSSWFAVAHIKVRKVIAMEPKKTSHLLKVTLWSGTKPRAGVKTKKRRDKT